MKTNLPQTVSFAERLVGHVFKLLGDRTWTPSGRIVLDHGGVELRHDLKSDRERQTSVIKRFAFKELMRLSPHRVSADEQH